MRERPERSFEAGAAIPRPLASDFERRLSVLKRRKSKAAGSPVAGAKKAHDAG
jgi:hypothetical protein